MIVVGPLLVLDIDDDCRLNPCRLRTSGDDHLIHEWTGITLDLSERSMERMQ